MRYRINIVTALLGCIIASPLFAGGNDLFEAKTATAAIKLTTDNVLSDVTSAERMAKKRAAKVHRKALKAYARCPDKSHTAKIALAKAARKLERYEDALARVSSTDPGLDALANFANDTAVRIDDLLDTDEVCDKGTTLTQLDDIDYAIDPAPFVNFGSAWGTLFSSAHGTFGDFAPESAAPDHVHSGTYYGVVIKGVVKNPFGISPGADVPNAKPLAAGSFWSVPANAIHTTACDAGPDSNCVFYFHSRKAFDFDTDITDGEISDDAQEISVDEIAAELAKPEAVVSPFARMYTVWGDRAMGAHGTVGEFIAGGESPLHTHTYSYHGVVLSGTMVNPFFDETVDEARELIAGDYWFVPAGVDHVTACVSEEPCTFYFHSGRAIRLLATAKRRPLGSCSNNRKQFRERVNALAAAQILRAVTAQFDFDLKQNYFYASPTDSSVRRNLPPLIHLFRKQECSPSPS